jgi:hypothetical protein
MRETIKKVELVLFILTAAVMFAGIRLYGENERLVFGYTNVRPDGNRLIIGRGSFPHVRFLDIKLSGRPLWVVVAPGNGVSVMAVVLEDGRTEPFSIAEGRVTRTEVAPERIPAGAPPLLVLKPAVSTFETTMLQGSFYLNNYHTNPVILPLSGRTAAIDNRGNIVVREKDQKGAITDRTVRVNALPDARILFDERERLFILTQPTDSYGHGILGDSLEATRITIVETDPVVRVTKQIPVENGKVIEGLSPILADLDGDGMSEIIVTVSDAKSGAQIAAYSETGEVIGMGPEIGRGYRWIHQIAVAPFGPAGEIELAAVRTPHIGGIIEYYRLSGGSLRIVAREKGISSHRIGSRNLDMAVAADFDGDGTAELLVPNQMFDTLLLLSRTKEGVEVESTYPVDGTVWTNIVAVTSGGEAIVVAVGREDGTLRVWVPYQYQ